MKKIFFVCLAITTIVSCKKINKENELIQADKPLDSSISTNKKNGLEKIDNTLLQKYVSYQLALESNSLKGIISSESNLPKVSKLEFKNMIENYLAHERNIMRKEVYLKNKLLNGGFLNRNDEDQECCGEPQGGGGTVTCVGRFLGANTTSSILFSATLNAAGSAISSHTLAYTGVNGTWANVGNISQSTHQGVITYQQLTTTTITLPGGTSYSQGFIVYGNIYNGGCTVSGMQTPVPYP